MRLLTRTFAIIFACSLFFLSGCDSLNLQPKDEIASEDVWKDPALAQAYLNDVYSSTGLAYGDPMVEPGLVDEAVNIHGHGDAPVVKSNMTPDDLGFWEAPGWRPPTNPPYEQYHWPSVYGTVRDINIFITNIQDSDAMPASQKETLLGEAYFLRAYFYHNLMQLHGGIPYITEVFELSGDISQYQVPRNTFKETIDNLVADLDRAAQRLSIDGRRKGAVTKGAALALKSRVLLYAASDLYNDSPFSGSEAAKFVSYQGGNQQQRWQKAKDAAQAVIDLGEYSLEQASSAQAYHELFTKGNESGTIWARYFSEDGANLELFPGHNQSLYVSPNGYNSWTGDAPTQNHVDAYEMADGSQFEWEGADPESADEPVDAKDPYDNRDPRFYANIHFNGKDWRPRPAGLQSIDPKGVIQTGWYEMPNQNNLRPGLDTREGPVQVWNGTKTGYNLAKFVARDINPSQEQAFNPWVHLRYAEILLNYAEASAELGDTQDALRALNKVRNRVGMPDVPADGGPNRTLIERIRQEREVELAFEGHRYFDVRRWMIAPEVYEAEGKGIRVVGRLVDESHPEAQQLVDNYYNYEYNVITVQDRRWQDRSYFVPISREEIQRNPELVQNPGY